MSEDYRAVCDFHNWRGVRRSRERNAELDAQDHEQEYERPGCQHVRVETI